jgi:hypothetical protein
VQDLAVMGHEHASDQFVFKVYVEGTALDKKL